MNATPRTACFILTATKGNVRAARTLVIFEIKRVIGKRYAPGCYMSTAVRRGGYS